MMREYRLFFVKLPNGYLTREIFSINKPISELRERLCDYLGVGEEGGREGRGEGRGCREGTYDVHLSLLRT